MRLIGQKRLEDGTIIRHPESQSAFSETGSIIERLELSRLRDVQNVNRLAADQEIEFNPHLTIVYGENASGKSGYVRILKHLASVRSVEAILPNVNRANRPSTPRAILEFKIGENEDQLEWNGEKGLSPVRSD